MSRANPATEMPFLDHLEELRGRLFWMIGALFVCTGFGFFAVGHFHLISVVAGPAIPYLPNGKLTVTHPIDGITIYMQLAITVGVILALPVILYQLWGFVAPALFPKEKKVAVAVLSGGLVLFLSGGALAFFFVVPATMRMSKTLGGDALQSMIIVSDYMSFVVTLVLTFGVAFELPIVIMALAALGLVTPGFLRTYRRHAIVLCVIAASFITPGDAVTATLALVGPLYFLYELGIFLAGAAQRWRERRDSAVDEPTPSETPA